MTNNKMYYIPSKTFLCVILFISVMIFTSCTYKYDLVIRNTSKFAVSIKLQFQARLNNTEYNFIKNNETKEKIIQEQNTIIKDLRIINSSNPLSKMFYNNDYWSSLQQTSIISRDEESITVQLLPNTSLVVDFLLNSRPANSSNYRLNPLRNWDKIIILTSSGIIEYENLKIIDMFKYNCRNRLYYYTIK